MSEELAEIIVTAERATAGSEADKRALAQLLAAVDLAELGQPEDRSYLAVLLDRLGMREQGMLALRPGADEHDDDRGAGLLNLAGILASGHGEYERARDLFTRAFSAAEASTLRARILTNLATLSLLVGEVGPASAWLARARDEPGRAGDPATEVLLASTEFGIMRAQGNLAGMRVCVSRLTEATRARVAELGPPCPSALTAVASLAAAEFELASAEESVEGQERAVGVLEIAAHRLAADLGADHPQALACLEDMCAADYRLARASRIPGRASRAASMLEAVYQRTASALGEEHPLARAAAANAAAARLGMQGPGMSHVTASSGLADWALAGSAPQGEAQRAAVTLSPGLTPFSETAAPIRVRATAGSQPISADGDIAVDQSHQVLYHDDVPDAGGMPFIRMIPAGGVPGFVGRADELDQLAGLLAPGAPRGGPAVLYPDNGQPGIGVTALALQAASRALATGWFGGGAVWISLHAGGERRRLALGQTLDSVLAALGHQPGREAGRSEGEQSAYQRTMEALAAAGRPVLIVIDEVRDTDARLIDALAPSGPHRLLLIAGMPLPWLARAQRLLVRYLNEDESVGVLATAMSPGSSGSAARLTDRHAHLQALARRCGGVAGALRMAAGELAARPGLSVPGLVQGLADAYDRDGGPAGPGSPPPGVGGVVREMVQLLHPVWGRPPALVVAGRRVIGRRALLSWLRADYLCGRPAAWDVVAGPGTGKSTLLAAVQAMLAEAGARAVGITMDVPADSYWRRRAGSDDPLVIELARMRLCIEVARAVGEGLPGEDNLAIKQLLYRAEQDIQEALAVHPELDIAGQLIPRGTVGGVSLPDREVSERYAEAVRTIRADLGRRTAELLSGAAGGGGRPAVLIDNLHLVTDDACRQWLAEVFASPLGAVTVVARRPGGEPFCEDAVTYQLRDFTRAETRAYLQLVAGIDAGSVDEPTLDALMSLTQGAPQAVAAQCDVLAGRLPSALSDAPGRSAAAPDDHLGWSLAANTRRLVANACQEELGRDLSAVLDYLVVLRHVNAGLLAAVLAGEVTRDQAGQLAARLARYTIMTSSDDDDPESFRLHERIRQYLLAEMPPETERRRHERAELAYAELVAGFEPEWDPRDGDAFSVWARFNSPEFQVTLREWLFHAMRSQGRTLSQPTGVRITQVFLEAFWWWGFYVDSPVCEQLLREFDLIMADKPDTDRQWLADLSTFYRNYGHGYVHNLPGSRKRDWAEVGSALMRVRRRVHLTRSKAMDRSRYAIDVITNVYWAQSMAFRQPGSDPQAAARLFADARQAARRSLEAGNRAHQWYDAWIVYFTADMWSACGQPREASASLRELDALAAADVHRDMIDRDLVGRAMSLQGDVYLAQGNYPRAIDATSRAALMAYVYHITQETPTQPPNEYTYMRHAECIAKASTCLAAVRDHDVAAWRAGIARMRATFAPYWRLADGRIAPSPSGNWPPTNGPALPDGIIPPLPDRAYLGQLDSPFTRLATLLANELSPFQSAWEPFREP